MVKNLPVSAGDLGLIPGFETIPWRMKATHSSILVWELEGYSPSVTKESDMT